MRESPPGSRSFGTMATLAALAKVLDLLPIIGRRRYEHRTIRRRLGLV